MMLLFSYRAAERPPVWGKSCSFALLCVSIVKVYQCVCVCASFPFGFEGGMCDLIALVPNHCLSYYFFRQKMGFFYERIFTPVAGLP